MQVHWVNADSEIGKEKLSRAKFSEFFAQPQPVAIAMEACGGAHHWAREFTALGHKVELCQSVKCALTCAATRTTLPMPGRGREN
ncbi:hypothetical protein BH09PSE5_BH09PSE5_32680 [soil metagenome]